MVKPDVFDWLILAGAVVLVVGLWLVSPALALIVLGVLIMGAGILGSSRQGKVGDGK
jgi:hypothetical protein